MIRTLILALLLAAVAVLPASGSTVSFDFAHVGNAGNAGELSGAGAGGVGPDAIVGAVSYNYAISTTEVTNAQYVEFLNAVAATDSFGGDDPTLYNTLMGSIARGGITRSGAPGSYTYATKSNMDNKPVNYVSFFDAMRFTNWLHNGQGSGGTETGAYTIGSGLDEVRSADAKFWIPSEDEWYKAAYHDATAGTAGVYFDYATGSDSVPTIAMANSVGDIINPGAGVVNYSQGADWNGQDGNVTTVGSAGLTSASPYGTFDQNGNVFEWNEAVISSYYRVLRGGSMVGNSISLRADTRSIPVPTLEDYSFGFRVATVPEPSSLLMGALAAVGLMKRR
ncbi:Formylglycine-generating sulfatase enzyme [Pseudobythopirellula maris]|uniref:Formylglycine-generating sulfatase enzyme n=1 Tax=Pseudobythopirellula maris TaxID=2527991 RepID=A0A5C5ZHA9_9BACT|nr:SUMF1/EgtB/PvdO family nonheme iron enzyme [Pseudobythopirellula maris]TWT86742.1 Formylglycine-generating sulfatase enzyme [Pseudobythopirellula maris]